MLITKDQYTLLKVLPYDKSYIKRTDLERRIKGKLDYDVFTEQATRLIIHNLVNGDLNGVGLRITDIGVKAIKDYKKVGFWAAHPFYEKVAICLLTAGLTYLVSSQITRTQRINQRLIDKRQDSLIQAASDSISSLQKHIKDYAKDTTGKRI